MAKKQVRLSEKAIQLAKDQLSINDSANPTPDELITLLIMQNQSSKEVAQRVLDYMGDEFTQRVNGQNRRRLDYVKGHFVENGSQLGISHILDIIDQTPTETGMSEILNELKIMRNENIKEHRKQFNMFNVYFSSLKLMIADLLKKSHTNTSDPASIVADITLSDETQSIVKGMDAYSLNDARMKSSINNKRQGDYDD